MTFKGFNTLRFFAAAFVILHHGETIRKKNNLPNFEHIPFFRNGATAVEFFFVLSGFLITFLLLEEHEKTQNIAVRKFYLRRIFRIWPLYFLLVFLGLIAVPIVINILNLNNPSTLPVIEAGILYLAILPNMVNVLYGNSLLTPLWSIGVEEQFYLFWAPLVKKFKDHLIKVFAIIIFLRWAFYAYMYVYEDKSVLMQFFQTLQFECMAIGGLVSFGVWKNRKDLTNLLIFRFEVFIWAIILVKLFFHEWILTSFIGEYYRYLFFPPIFRTTIWSLIFAALLCIVGLKKNNILSFKLSFFEKLGEWSYGMYMYHLLIIFGIIAIFGKQKFMLDDFFGNVIYFVLLFCGVIAISSVSFLYFEKKFLKLKDKFGKTDK